MHDDQQPVPARPVTPPGRRIEIVPYDVAWPRRFAEESRRLQAALAGAGATGERVAIEHIGSTAVPGLAAKPVLDVMIGLRRFPASTAVLRALGGLGYHEHGEAGIAGRHYLTDAAGGRPRSRHLHAVEHGSWFWREHLRFRDHLRRHADEAAAYAELKRRLASRHRHDAMAYTEGKTEFVHGALARARAGEGVPRVHEAAGAGFDAAAGAYERARPGYPREAVAFLARELGLGPGRRVVELGAGTGKLTQSVLATGAAVTAVEPVEAMRRVLAAAFAGVTVVDGTAEELPLEGGTAAAALAGQAFHWFDAWAALSELHRVLVDGGPVALVWNVRDESVDWVARWTDLLRPVAQAAPRERSSPWRDAVVRTALFTDPVTRAFENPHVVPREAVVERVASTSTVAALRPDRRDDLLGDFRRLLASHPQTRGREEITVPYRTEVHTFRRVP